MQRPFRWIRCVESRSTGRPALQADRPWERDRENEPRVVRGGSFSRPAPTRGAFGAQSNGGSLRALRLCVSRGQLNHENLRLEPCTSGEFRRFEVACSKQARNR